MAEFTIVVQDGGFLSRICGTNDCNLKLIESFLGTRVFARGNELSIESGGNSSSSSIEQQFSFIIDRILDEFSCAQDEFSDGEIIRSVLNTREFLDDSLFSRSSISIPGGVKKIYPRTKGQAKLVSRMRESDVVFASGPAGSGKTFLCVAESLRLLLSKKVSSVILTRPVVEAGESLGFLPGNLEEKINPYISPLYDSIDSLLPRETARRLTENGVIEAAPLAYMRGRTLSNCAIILDEAQNTTIGQMKMFLTRMGENSKVFVTGDPTQTDLPQKIPSGFSHATEILCGISGISVVELTADDVVRNQIVKKIIQAYENEER